jgi:hypothetical protein
MWPAPVHDDLSVTGVKPASGGRISQGIDFENQE